MSNHDLIHPQLGNEMVFSLFEFPEIFDRSNSESAAFFEKSIVYVVWQIFPNGCIKHFKFQAFRSPFAGRSRKGSMVVFLCDSFRQCSRRTQLKGSMTLEFSLKKRKFSVFDSLTNKTFKRGQVPERQSKLYRTEPKDSADIHAFFLC